MITTTNDFLNNQTSSFRWSINARFNSTSPNSSDVNLNHSVQPIDITSSALGIFLSLFCFITVFGNGLVIYAIVQERYLKSATYYYMASLACADLFVGLIVMPFSIVQVIYGDYWPFGRLCCDLWHSIDVCASTASILDLCVIALDRYSAITNPMSYHRTFFVKRWPYLLMAVWLCSGLISFPAVAYWRLRTGDSAVDRCLFPEDIYYLVFSSLISFYIPLIVMIFVYIRIYRAAIKQLHAFKTGVKLASPTNKRKKKKKSDSKDDPTPENQPADICLRIHRGKYHGVPSLTRDSSSTMNPLDAGRASSPDERLTSPAQKASPKSARKSISTGLMSDHHNAIASRFSMPSLGASKTTVSSNHQLIAPITANKRVLSQETLAKNSSNPSSSTGTSLGKRLTKFSKEQKATITLAYVMGIFVICWLPFFIYNPLTAIAKTFITRRTNLSTVEKILTGSDLLFQMFTWLGYVNSSVNPIIYAYSSREFRRAFIKYLCRCFPIRIRNLMMSYHNLHLLRYRRTPESNMSKENIDVSTFDTHNHNSNNNNNNNNINNNNNNNINKNLIKTNQISMPTMNKDKSNRRRDKRTNRSRRFWSLTSACCRSKFDENQNQNKDKRSSSNVSSRAMAAPNVLVDYCTYHDVAVARVTCL